VIALSAVLLLGVAGLGGGAYYYLSEFDLLGWLAGIGTRKPPESKDAKGPATDRPPGPKETRPPIGSDGIRRYVEQYNGGQCFFITPVAIGEGRATIEGFGASLPPFNTFDQAFKRQIGFEADIGIRLVTEAQCPVITFLAGLRTDRARAPRVDIDSAVVKDGSSLTGLVDRFGNLNVELLLVSDAGTVQNITTLMRPGTDGKPFNIRMQKTTAGAESQPQLLVAVTSVRPLMAFQLPGAAGADQVFPAALAEAQRSGQQVAATARYFRLER
jgi:hypothetical protein